MIAASNDPGTCGVGDTSCTDGNFVAMFTECCDLRGEQERCNSWEGELFFPRQNCDFVGIALAMPTCWDGRIDSPDHKSHMAYTLDGQVNGECPASHTRRLPQVQVFIRIPNYRGVEFEYVLSDGNRIPGSNGAWNFHTDFFNGWDEGKFQEIMDNCAPSPEQDGYNPPCDCTPGEESTYDGGLTPNTSVPDSVCDADVKRLIVDEEIKVTSTLPLYSGSCMGSDLKPRFWTDLSSDLFSTNCNDPITEPYYTSTTSSTQTTTTTTTPVTTTTSSTSSQTTTTTTTPATTTTTTTTTPATTTTSSTSSQTTTTTTSTTPQTTTTTTTPQTTTTTTTPQTTTTATTTPQTTTTTSTTTTTTEAPPGEVLKAIVCGNGGDCAEAPEGWDVANTYDRHEVRCCRECIEGNCPRAWKEKCPFYDDEVYARSKIKGACREEATFLEAIALCNSVGGRLCTPWEVFEGCTAGTGCGFDREMIWACSYEGHECEEDAECCGLCVEGFCEGDPQDLFA